MCDLTVVVQGASDDSEPTDASPVACTWEHYVLGSTSVPCPDTHLTGFGGHVRGVGEGATLQLDGVEFYRMGMTNVLGRYPLHFHHSSNGGEGEVTDCAVRLALRPPKAWVVGCPPAETNGRGTYAFTAGASVAEVRAAPLGDVYFHDLSTDTLYYKVITGNIARDGSFGWIDRVANGIEPFTRGGHGGLRRSPCRSKLSAPRRTYVRASAASASSLAALLSAMTTRVCCRCPSTCMGSRRPTKRTSPNSSS